MIDYNIGTFMHQYTNDLLPKSFQGIFKKLRTHDRNLNYETQIIRLKCVKSIPSHTFTAYWNSLSLDMKRSSSLNIFKKSLSQHFLEQYSLPCGRTNCTSCA